LAAGVGRSACHVHPDPSVQEIPMSTAPGSEPLAKQQRKPADGGGVSAGPCDTQDPPPRIPDDTPADAHDAPPAPGSGGADRGGVPAPAIVPSTTAVPDAADTPGAQEVTVEGDLARSVSEHDTSGMKPPVAKTTASRG
jgi:hypothetical protein